MAAPTYSIPVLSFHSGRFWTGSMRYHDWIQEFSLALELSSIPIARSSHLASY